MLVSTEGREPFGDNRGLCTGPRVSVFYQSEGRDPGPPRGKLLDNKATLWNAGIYLHSLFCFHGLFCDSK